MGQSIEPYDTKDNSLVLVLVVVQILAIYCQTNKLEAWLKINQWGDSQKLLKGQSIMYQIPLLDLY